MRRVRASVCAACAKRFEAGGADLLENGVTDAMVSLNAALATDGVVIDVADGATLAKPLQIIHVGDRFFGLGLHPFAGQRSARARASRWWRDFVAADGAKAYQAHDAVLLSVGDGAELTQVRLMADARGCG